MINYDKINAIKVKSQTNEQNVRREYFQHLFLFNLYKQDHSDKVFFKGGTALRLVFRSPRYSEDLDFSSKNVDQNILEGMVENALLEIERSGIETDIKESKITTGGYLAMANFRAWKLDMGLKIEISYRDSNPTGTLSSVENEYIPTYSITTLKKSTITTEKVTALLTRAKPRDFYDIYFLLRANLLTSKNKLQLQQINAVLQSTKINFDKELKVFLPQSHWGLIENFKQILSDELKRYL